MPEESKKLVHEITNHMQSVLGYFELQEYGKAKEQIKDAIKLLGRLRRAVCVLIERTERATKK